MAMTQLVTLLNIVKFQNNLKALLDNELVNQKKLASKEGVKDEEIAKAIHFETLTDQYNIANVIGTHKVFVNIKWAKANLEFSTIGENRFKYNVYFDCCVSKNLTGAANGDAVNNINKDTAAGERLNYLIAQVQKIVDAEENYFKNSFDFYESCNLIKIEKSEIVDQPEQAPTGQMARLDYEIVLTETVEQKQGYTILGIDIHKNLTKN